MYAPGNTLGTLYFSQPWSLMGCRSNSWGVAEQAGGMQADKNKSKVPSIRSRLRESGLWSRKRNDSASTSQAQRFLGSVNRRLIIARGVASRSASGSVAALCPVQLLLRCAENKTASRWAKGYARGRSVPPLRGLSPLLYSPRLPPPAIPFSQPRSMPLCAP